KKTTKKTTFHFLYLLYGHTFNTLFSIITTTIYKRLKQFYSTNLPLATLVAELHRREWDLTLSPMLVQK
ncbi:MAG: hypothetical protein ACJ8F5_00145, partial [Bacillales bacterium]